jgi:hypothetical protein
MLKYILLVSLLIFAFLSGRADCAQTRLVDRQRRTLFPEVTIDSISPATRQVAEELELMPMLEELFDKRRPLSTERKILVRAKILETILEASFDADSVSAEADRETARLAALSEHLSSRRDRAVNLNNASNFIASGTLNTIGSVLGFSSKTPPFPGNLNQMLSGVVSTGMSAYSLKQAAGGKTGDPSNPTILAELFGRPVSVQTSYPESVWRFLHSRSVDDPTVTRAQWLEQHWIKRKHLDPPGSPREKLKIDIVCGAATGRQTTIDDLSDQIAMISDVSMMVQLMTHHLRDLMRVIDLDEVLRIDE